MMPARSRAAVADDDPAFRQVLQEALERLGFDVVSFDDGDALALAVIARPPDVVVTDQHMPVCHGTTALRRVRAAGVRCPAIVIAAFPEPELEAEVGAIEGCVLLSKALDLAGLVAVLPRG